MEDGNCGEDMLPFLAMVRGLRGDSTACGVFKVRLRLMLNDFSLRFEAQAIN